jgi:hypothetical protein
MLLQYTMIIWNSIKINSLIGSEIFNGYYSFDENSNKTTSFYDNINPNVDILITGSRFEWTVSSFPNLNNSVWYEISNNGSVTSLDPTGSTIITSIIVTINTAIINSPFSAICYLKSTPILTPIGYQLIENLSIGNEIITGDNRIVKISEIFHKNYQPSDHLYPYIVPVGLFDCSTEIYLSPNHGIIINGYVVPVKYMNLLQKTDLKEIEYYNLKLEDYFTDTIVAGGLITESWDGITIMDDSFLEKWCKAMKYKSLIIEGSIGKLCIQDNFRQLEIC